MMDHYTLLVVCSLVLSVIKPGQSLNFRIVTVCVSARMHDAAESENAFELIFYGFLGFYGFTLC